MRLSRLPSKTLRQLTGIRIPEWLPPRRYKYTLCAPLLCAMLIPALPSEGAEQFLITPISVTSASSATDLFPASTLINNSGLNPVPTLTSFESAEHGSASPSRAWATAAPGGGGRDYFSGGNLNPVLPFTLP